jgi:hypothetical protein
MSRYISIFGEILLRSLAPALVGRSGFTGVWGWLSHKKSGGDAACFCDTGTDGPTVRLYATKSHSTHPVYLFDYQVVSLMCLPRLRFRAHHSERTSWNLGNTLDRQNARQGRRWGGGRGGHLRGAFDSSMAGLIRHLEGGTWL